jgi:O-antigen ligase
MIETMAVGRGEDSKRARPAPDRRFRAVILVVLGISLIVLVAYLIAGGKGWLAVAAVALVPGLVLLSVHPFSGVLLWLLVMPFSSALPNSSLVYWAVYRILPPVLLGLALMSRLRRARAHPTVRFGPPELALSLLVLLVPAAILFFQADARLALIRFADRILLPFCMYLVVRVTAPREKEFVQLQWLVFFVAVSQSLIGFLSWSTPQILPSAWHYLNGERTTGSLRDPDLYAAVLAFSAALLIHMAANHKSGVIRLLLFSAAGLCGIFVFLSLERAAWVGGVLVILGLVAVYPKIMLRLLLIGALVMVVLGAGLLSTHLALSVSRISDSNPVLDRLVVFDAMWQMIQLKPVEGWGYETLDQNIQHFYRRVGEATIVNRFLTSHNTYLTILTELGLVGFALYMFPVVWWLVLSVRVWPRLPKTGLWSRALLAVLWLGLLFQFTVSNFFDMRWFEIGLTLWWMTLGLIANLVYPYLKTHSVPAPAHIGLGEPHA